MSEPTPDPPEEPERFTPPHAEPASPRTVRNNLIIAAVLSGSGGLLALLALLVLLLLPALRGGADGAGPAGTGPSAVAAVCPTPAGD